MTPRPQLFGKTLFVDFLMANLAMLLGIMMLADVTQKKKTQQQQVQEAGLRTEGKLAVTMSWPDTSPDDVDLYVRDPAGNIAFFSARDAGLMHLDHDDMGLSNDRNIWGMGTATVERNEERVILRGLMAGEYIVNVHMYGKRGHDPTPVTVKLLRLRGEDANLAERGITLTHNGHEVTAFRFTVRPDESIVGINELPRSLMRGGK